MSAAPAIRALSKRQPPVETARWECLDCPLYSPGPSRDCDRVRNTAHLHAYRNGHRVVTHTFYAQATDRACGACGCTEHNACVVGFDGESPVGCHWVGPRLCSRCSNEFRAPHDPPERRPRAPRKASGRRMIGGAL